MAYNYRLPIYMDGQPTHPLHRLRSEVRLESTPERTCRRLCSLGQLSPPPDWPLPPVPLRSPLRPASRAHCPPTSSNSGSSFSSHYEQDDATDSSHDSVRNTMLIKDQFGQKKIESTLRRNSKRTPRLEDLSQLLHLRGRLQEMGTTFTVEGKMNTYGNPPLNSEFEQMLRLGAMYDERWRTFFGEKTEEVGNNLWADLDDLKKMLRNEGVAFGSQHKRLNYGTSHPKLVRLSDQYDVLYEEWLAMTMQNVHPAQRHERRLNPVKLPESRTPANLGWKFLLDDDGDGEDELVRKKSRRSSRFTIVFEEQANVDNGPGPILEEGDGVYAPPPLTPEALTSARASENTVTRPCGYTVGVPALIHSSSPLQAANTASMLLQEAQAEAQAMSTVDNANVSSQQIIIPRHEHTGVRAFLVEDERRRAEERRCTDMPALHDENTNEIAKKARKSKGLRK